MSKHRNIYEMILQFSKDAGDGEIIISKNDLMFAIKNVVCNCKIDIGGIEQLMRQNNMDSIFKNITIWKTK